MEGKSMMMKKNILNTSLMFQQACAFADCASCCEIEPNNIIEFRFKSHTVAGIVNSALSCEIFIKALLVHNEEYEIKGHKLKELWNILREKDPLLTSSLQATMQSIFNSNNEDLFIQLLDNISNAFTYWRYIYEKDSGAINLNFLTYFRILLRDACCLKLYNKTWEEYKEDYMHSRQNEIKEP